MSQTFAVDGSNDLYLTGGLLTVVNGLAAVTQNCEHAAKTILNEMVLAQGEGVPYFEDVWVGVPNLPLFEAALRARIAAVADVLGVVALVTSRDGNVLRYTATIRTPYGTGLVNGNL